MKVHFLLGGRGKKRELYMEYRRMSCQERNGQLCEFCERFELRSHFKKQVEFDRPGERSPE